MAHQVPKDTFEPETRGGGGRSVLIMTDNNTEDLEFFYPYYRFIEEGYDVDVATPKGGAFQGKNGYGLQNTKKLKDVSASDYDLLYIPGGKAPASLKKCDEALNLAEAFVKSGKPVAAICHGPQVLAEAGLITDRRIAAWPEVEKEVTQAGATYVSEETVVDGPFITARWPADLPMHLKKTLEILEAMGERPAHRASDVEMATSRNLQ